MRLAQILMAALLLTTGAAAGTLNTIDGTSLYLSLDAESGFDSASAFDVDGLSFDLTAEDYNLTGLLQIRPVTEIEMAKLEANGFSARSAPFSFELATFIDLTELTLTCTLTEGECGAFFIDFEVYLDPLTTGETIVPVSAAVDGTGPGDMDLFGSLSIEVFDNSFGFVDGLSGKFGTTIDSSGSFNEQLFSSALNVSGASNISFFGFLGSETGLQAGQTLLLPDSFTAVLGSPSAIPEPGTVWLMLSGAAALAFFRRRKQS